MCVLVPHSLQISLGIQASFLKVCHVKPKFVERGRVHPYCGRGCAAQAPKPPPSSGRGGGGASSASWSVWGSTASSTPAPPASSAPAWTNTTPQNHSGNPPASGAVRLCLMCKARPCNEPHDFCSKSCGFQYTQQRGGGAVQNFNPRGPRLEERGPQSNSGQMSA